MTLEPEVVKFVQAAVRLPPDRLRRIDRQWDKLSAERRVISEVVRETGAEIRLPGGGGGAGAARGGGVGGDPPRPAPRPAARGAAGGASIEPGRTWLLPGEGT